MANWTPTPKEIEQAGDCMFEALRLLAREHRVVPTVGDLAIEVTANDWEGVGYVIERGSPFGARMESPWLIWTVGRRLCRWHNADFYRIGPYWSRIPSLPFPTPDEIVASKLEPERI
jgi:hypothetical protein